MPVAFRSAWQINNCENWLDSSHFPVILKTNQNRNKQKTEFTFDRQKLLSILNFTDKLNQPGFVGCSASYVASITVFVIAKRRILSPLHQ